MNKKLISGAFWMSFGSILSRVLGVVYLIPWLLMLGNRQIEAQAIFNSAYVPYSLFLSLGTAGFPTAIAKIIAEFRKEHSYNRVGGIFICGSILMIMAGIIMGVLLYFFSFQISKNSPVSNLNASVTSIRWMVPAVVIIPFMSYLRGFFQGTSELKVFGISLLMEQFFRVIFILIFTYIYVKSDFYKAIYLSTFSAFIGALASLVFLIIQFKRNFNEYKIFFLDLNIYKLKKDFFLDFKNILHDSIPYVLIGSLSIILQLMDQFGFKFILENQKSVYFIQNEYVFFSANPGKVTLVIFSLSISIGSAILPIISGEKNVLNLKKNIINNFNLEFKLLIPILGLACASSKYIYIFLFNNNQKGEEYLFWALLLSIFSAILINSEAVIQALDAHITALQIMALCIILKVLTMFSLIHSFFGIGALFSTGFASIISFFVSIYWLKRKVDLRYAEVFNREFFITLLYSLVMYLVLTIIQNKFYSNVTSKIGSLTVMCLNLFLFFLPLTILKGNIILNKIKTLYRNM